MTATVITIADLRDARAGRVDNRTDVQRLVDQARAEGFRDGAGEGFMRGMQAAMESMRAPVPAMLPVRRLTAVQMGGWAS